MPRILSFYIVNYFFNWFYCVMENSISSKVFNYFYFQLKPKPASFAWPLKISLETSFSSISSICTYFLAMSLESNLVFSFCNNNILQHNSENISIINYVHISFSEILICFFFFLITVWRKLRWTFNLKLNLKKVRTTKLK